MTDKKRIFATCRIGDPAENRLRERGYELEVFQGPEAPPKKLADALLDDAGVAALSGTAFGDFGEGYLRFSVANSIENIEKALDRVGAWAEANL